MPKKTLITGGAGFIGSHLADHLIAQGHEVHILDDLSTGHLGNVRGLLEHERFSYTVGSVLDYHTLERHVSWCDEVYHLAAAVGVKLIMERPVETIVTNVQGTENVLKLANYHKKKVLVASTSEVYGKSMEKDGQMTALHEGDDLTMGPTKKRRWAYACSKALDEFLSMAYADEKGLPVVVARFFNTVGPRQTGRYGMVIPNFVQRALQNEPIQVFGDGEQTRCFTYVGDVVRSIAALMAAPEAEGEIFNIGGLEEVSMNELAERVCTLADSTSEIVHIPYEEVYGEGFEDMKRRTPDISKLRSMIDYAPTYSTDAIIREVIAYFKEEAARPSLHRLSVNEAHGVAVG